MHSYHDEASAKNRFIDQRLAHFAGGRSHVRKWWAKEDNWVNYDAFKHLLQRRQPGGVLYDPAQIAIEVSAGISSKDRLLWHGCK